MVSAISFNSSAVFGIPSVEEGIFAKIWRVAKGLFETIYYLFERIKLWYYASPFQSQQIPATIPNQGNTCFAAAWMQLVASNCLLAGAYRSTLKSKGISSAVFGQHPVVKILDQYRKRQSDPSVSIDIQKMREVFSTASIDRAFFYAKKGQFSQASSAVQQYRNPDLYQQEDAGDLLQQVENKMVMPSDGRVELEDGSIVQYGYRRQVWIPSEKQWRDETAGQEYLAPIFSLNFMDENSDAPSLVEMIKTNYLDADTTKIQLLDLPNTLIFNVSRMSTENGVEVVSRNVYAPLFLTLPSALLAGKTSPQYLLQGFVSHSLGSASSGHYIAYVQAAGKFWKMNDGIRTEIGIHEFLQAAKTAYSLNYVKVS